MPWEFGKASDIGGRTEQQDRLGILSDNTANRHLLVIADGMGGHTDGALAAETVLDTAKGRFDQAKIHDPQTLLDEICHTAHQSIKTLAGDNGSSPGSTCALLYLHGPEAYWAHIGDSRIYHFRGHRLETRTVDHSVAQLMLTQQKIEESEIPDSGLQHQLYMRLGGDQLPEPEFGATEVHRQDLFVLCTDGLWASVSPKEITNLAGKNLKEGADQLVALAKTRNGEMGDNVSLVLARWRPTDSSRGGFWRKLIGKLKVES